MVVREKELHEPDADKQHQPIVQVGCERLEIVARLQRKGRQGAKHERGEYDGLEEHRDVHDRDDGAEEERLHQREQREEHEVRGVRLALPVQCAERGERADERHKQEPRAA